MTIINLSVLMTIGNCGTETKHAAPLHPLSGDYT
jgi:hypothetical protein